MADSLDQGSADRHATWVGLRTVRQRPRVVDHMDGGQPVYEIRSVRLVLAPGAAHFSRLVECAKCGREVPGPPVLEPGDLDRPSNPVICKDCVRAAGVATSWPRESRSRPRPPSPSPVAEPATPPNAGAAGATARPARRPAGSDDGGRLDAIESQVRSALTQLRELADVQRSQSIARREADQTLQGRLQEALVAGLAELRAEMAAPGEPDPASAQGLADQVRRNVTAMAQALQAQRAEVATLVDGLARAHFEVATLEERLQSSMLTLTRMVETQRADLEAAVRNSARPDLSALARTVEELARAGTQVDARVEAVVGQVADAGARVDAIVAAVDRNTTRLDRVEQATQDAVQRLSALVEAQRRDLEAALASPAGRTVVAGIAPFTDPLRGDPVDILERQLSEAASRLAQRSLAGDHVD